MTILKLLSILNCLIKNIYYNNKTVLQRQNSLYFNIIQNPIVRELDTFSKFINTVNCLLFVAILIS